ncbi:unnamed protein product [Calicophoron daubneyi]
MLAGNNDIDPKSPTTENSDRKNTKAPKGKKKQGRKRISSPAANGLNTDVDQPKKTKIDEIRRDGVSCSRVVHLRNLPPDITEIEVANMAAPFGTINNMMLLRKSVAALIELTEEEAAVQMVHYYSAVFTPVLRDRLPIGVGFSKYTELNSTSTQQVDDAIQAANKLFNSTRSTFEQGGQGTRNVVRVQIDKTPGGLPFGYREFYRMFGQFGHISRIVSFKVGTTPNALIEYEDPLSAHVAIVQTNGLLLPLGVNSPFKCHVKAMFSHQSKIEIHKEDVNCRDFTQHPLLGPQELDDPAPGVCLNSTPIAPSKLTNHDAGSMAPRFDLLEQFTEERLGTLDIGVLSELARRLVKPLLKAALSVNGQNTMLLRSQAEVLEELSTSVLRPGSKLANAKLPVMPNLASKTPSLPVESEREFQSRVVFVSNLDPERVTPNTLFTLLGVYGDVDLVKIMHNNRNSALVQFTDSAQAQRVVNFLNGIPLFGKRLRCVISKKMELNNTALGREDSCDDNCSQSYPHHRLHRFKFANSRNAQNICPPSKSLHVSGLPEDVSEEEIKEAFTQTGGQTVLDVQLKRSPKTMAFVELPDLEKAVSTLIALDDYELRPGCHIRVTFCKTTAA